MIEALPLGEKILLKGKKAREFIESLVRTSR